VHYLAGYTVKAVVQDITNTLQKSAGGQDIRDIRPSQYTPVTATVATALQRSDDDARTNTPNPRLAPINEARRHLGELAPNK
jgi:hypothetical protein